MESEICKVDFFYFILEIHKKILFIIYPHIIKISTLSVLLSIP